MIVCIVRIVLCRIAFRNDGICRKIEEQAAVFPDDSAHQTVQAIVFDDLPDDKPCTYFLTSAVECILTYLRKLLFREVQQIVLVRIHLVVLIW